MKTYFASLLFIITLFKSVAVLAAGPQLNVNDAGIAIKGYDPVAYFTESKAVRGTPDYKASHNGATYYFASKENQKRFSTSPETYTPQFGGFCAYGVTKKQKFDTDPTAWKIVDGKLYLNLNKKVQKIWKKDITGNIMSANSIWSDIKDTPAEKL